MKRKMKKKLIAFMLCMVLVICNSVSILADTPAAATTTAENQVSETKTAKNEKSSEETKSTDDNDTSKQSEETDETKDKAPEATTTEKKEATTEATTEDKEDATTATTEAEEPTTEATTEDKATTEAADETSESDKKKKEATTAENSAETSGTTEEATEAADETTTAAEDDETTAATALKYEDEQVLITVTANEENAIPAGATLQVVPVVKDDAETQTQYAEVEKQLQTKAEEDDHTTLGFLAYDITFTDAQGNELEPNGQVVVNMSYKKATLPSEINADNETIAEADVSVLHLEEDENKQVKNVADLSENNQLQNIEVTDAKEVKQAEFVAESFSVFVIEWGNYYKIEAEIVDDTGKQIDCSSEIEDQLKKIFDSSSGTVNFSDKEFTEENGKYYQISDTDGKDFFFTKAVVLNSGENYNGKNGTEIKRFRRQNRQYEYNTQEYGGRWNDYRSSYQKLVLVYGEGLTTIETVDSASKGITMRMINYDDPTDIGGGYGDGTVKQGLLKNTLADNGYPVARQGGNLSKLFAGGTSVNHLFSQEIYDETGYYEYSSFENYAFLNDNGDFSVYEQIGTPSNEENYFYQRGNFMPYNRIKPGLISTNTNRYNEKGQALDESNPRYNEKLYKTDGTNDFYFGMYLEANFVQPRNGEVTHKGKTSDMLYEFNGDDDLWIFIDNVLVLDIGGIHDAHSGSINFATGEVLVYSSKKNEEETVLQRTTIKELFETAGKFPDGSQWQQNRVNDYFAGNTFKNFSAHTFKMFYMERGAGASNLHMKFNIPVIQEGDVHVRKELTNTDKEKYADVEFAFQVWVQKEAEDSEEDNPIFTEDYELVNGEKYTVKDNSTGNDLPLYNDVTFEGSTESYDNVFYLKADEEAVISSLKENQKYYVIELGVKSSEYDKVTINDTEYTNGEDGDTPTKNFETTKEEAGVRPMVVYYNNCSAANSKELRITKKMVSGQSSDDVFSFKIELEDQNNKFALYDGEYYIKKDGKNYKYDDQGNLVVTKGTAGTAQNGIISGIPKDYAVVITQILSGTSFRVQEVGLSDLYADPIITVEENTAGESDVAGGTGSILLGKDAEVTVLNRKNIQSIFAQKQWDDGQNTANRTNVIFGLFKENAEKKLELLQVQTLTKDTDWKCEFKNLPVKENGKDITYYVKELQKTSDTTNSYLLEETYYKILNNSDYLSPYYQVSGDTIGKGTQEQPFIITNKLKTFNLNVVKTGSDTTKGLEGVEFKLSTNKNGEGEVHFLLQSDGVYTYAEGTSEVGDTTTTLITNGNDNGVPNLNVSGLPAGTYYLFETKTQNGYSLLADPIEVILPLTSTTTEGMDEDFNYYIETNVSGENVYYYDTNTFEIVNNKLFTMPEAGGRNIFMITLAGTAMIALAAGSTIYYRRRRGTHNKTRR